MPAKHVVLQEALFDEEKMAVCFHEKPIVEVLTVDDGIILQIELNKFLKSWEPLPDMDEVTNDEGTSDLGKKQLDEYLLDWAVHLLASTLSFAIVIYDECSDFWQWRPKRRNASDG